MVSKVVSLAIHFSSFFFSVFFILCDLCWSTNSLILLPVQIYCWAPLVKFSFLLYFLAPRFLFLCYNFSLLISLFDETCHHTFSFFLPLKSYYICLSLCLVTSQIILAKSFFFLTMWSLWYWVLEETAMGKRTATLGWQWFWQHCLSLALSQTTTQLLTSTNCCLMALLFSIMPWGTQLLFNLIKLNLGFFTGIVFLR